MIATLRRRHRTHVLLAAVAAPAILFVALMARAPMPYDNVFNSARNNLPEDTVLLASNNLRVGAAMLSAQVYAASDRNLASYLTIGKVKNRESAGPDVLVYWQQHRADDGLGTDATLLGPMRQQRASHFVLPEPTTSGYVVFYSLAHQRVLSTYPLAQLLEEK